MKKLYLLLCVALVVEVSALKESQASDLKTISVDLDDALRMGGRIGLIHEELSIGKTHRDFLEQNRHLPVPVRERIFPDTILDESDLKKGPVVYGYLPYWEMDYEGFQWDVLTHVAYFCAELGPDGNVFETHHWLKPSVQALIAEAHQHNVQVVLSVVNFEGDEIAAICNNPDTRALAIDNLLSLVQEAGGDGINIDFEFVPPEAKASFVLFMSELTEAFHEAIPGSHVSYAGPCVDWTGAYDYDQLALACDDVFIMGYCYHPHHQIPGPKAPIEGGDVWWSKHLTSTIEEYVTWGGANIEETMVLGLPFYGYTWKVEAPEIPTVYLEEGALNVAASIDEYSTDGPWEIEPVSLSSYQQFTGEDGAWRQRWLDNAESHSHKYQLACDRGLKGVGFWALGYDGGDGPIWDALRATLESCEQWKIPDESELIEEADVIDGPDSGEMDDEQDTTESEADGVDSIEGDIALLDSDEGTEVQSGEPVDGEDVGGEPVDVLPDTPEEVSSEKAGEEEQSVDDAFQVGTGEPWSAPPVKDTAEAVAADITPAIESGVQPVLSSDGSQNDGCASGTHRQGFGLLLLLTLCMVCRTIMTQKLL